MKDKSRSTTGSHDEPMPDISQPRSPASSHRSYPMPDYSRPISLASTRNTSENTNHGKDPTRLVSMLHQGLAKHVHDEEYHFDDYVVSLSPRKDSNYSGISAPSNTRVSSAANTPPGRPSAAAEIRALSYSGMPRSVSVTTRDPPPPNYRVLSSGGKPHSNSHTSDSRHSEIQTEIEERPDAKPKKKPVGRPAGSVKGRKEGRTSETTLEALTSKTRRRVSAPSASSCEKESSDESDEKIGGEGKRKRGTKLAESMVSLEDRLDNANSSPTRKVSKTGHKEENPVDIADMDDLTAEGVVVRHPLGELDNIV